MLLLKHGIWRLTQLQKGKYNLNVLELDQNYSYQGMKFEFIESQISNDSVLLDFFFYLKSVQKSLLGTN